jgi:hypothetical protein
MFEALSICVIASHCCNIFFKYCTQSISHICDIYFKVSCPYYNFQTLISII